jgi:predicted dehydrogenase
VSMTKTVGFAILGAGVVADYHRQAIAANAERGARLVAIGHYDRTKYPEISERLGIPCVSQEQILADPEWMWSASARPAANTPNRPLLP